ncbi:alr0857 family protein [Microcoleus sp. bin38.metabat.b11b12b14.051]|uniref:alr0857 family protein n=1 Tax=Microcoleus sp. bin38.metabat.b11b12b14.051 TaxID=2742709 RepID=UPI0025F7CB37|nr:alr0857 family protein [Microcoleus sp. bin38.metabat.b11b12b14.051]
MLKLTYTETGFNLERLAQSPEQLVALRVVLAMRVGQSISVEPSTAAFLLPANLPALSLLESEARRDDTDSIDLCVADADFVEVTLRGTWIGESEGAQGVFATVLSDRAERLLLALWLETQAAAEVVGEVGD